MCADSSSRRRDEEAVPTRRTVQLMLVTEFALWSGAHPFLDMKSLLFYSGEIVKYVIVAELYFLTRTYMAQRSGKTVCQTCSQRSLARKKKRAADSSNRVNGSIDSGSTETAASPSPAPIAEKETAEKEVARALFFPDASLVTPSVRPTGGFNQIGEYAYSTEYLNDHPTDGPFNELLKLLKSARKSLDLCIYVLSFPPLCDLIMDLYDKQAIRIRIIVDGREDEALRSQIPRLSRRGIEIRCNEKSYSILMHNKFAIVDSNLLLTGSLNWTKSAVLLNYDNVLVTNNKSLVEQYSAHFNLLWSKFKPYGSA